MLLIRAVGNTKCVFVLGRTLQHIQERLREEHSLQHVLFKSLMKDSPSSLPPRYTSYQTTSIYGSSRFTDAFIKSSCLFVF